MTLSLRMRSGASDMGMVLVLLLLLLRPHCARKNHESMEWPGTQLRSANHFSQAQLKIAETYANEMEPPIQQLPSDTRDPRYGQVW